MKISCFGLLALALAPSALGLAAPDDKSEPPARYTLKMGDKSLALTLDKEIEVESAAGPTRLKLSRDPLRQFEKSGVTFRYPVEYAFGADSSELFVTIWTMSGVDSIVMLQRFPLVPTETLRQTMITGLTEEYGRKNVTIAPTSLLAGGRKIAGQQIKVLLVSQPLVQEVFVFSTSKNSFVLVLQDTPNKSGLTAEFKRLKALVASSLRF